MKRRSSPPAAAKFGSRYPWDEILGVAEGELHRGRDFHYRPDTMRVSLYAAARRLGVKVSVRLPEDRPGVILYTVTRPGKGGGRGPKE